MSTVPNYTLPVYRNADLRARFQISGYNLTANTAKLQFRDATSGDLALELLSPTKIEIEVTDTDSGFITLIISAADSLLLSANVKWDLFVIDGAGKRKALVKGDVCYTTSQTTF